MVQAIIGVLGAAGLLVIVISQARINTLNYYQSSSNFERLLGFLFGIKIRRQLLVVATTVLVFLLMLTDVFSYLQQALIWQGVFFVGWVGITLTHYALVPADRRPARSSGRGGSRQ